MQSNSGSASSTLGLGKNVVAIVGLGYVGLPLAIELSTVAEVVGFDINNRRVSELVDKIDRTSEVDRSRLDAYLARSSFTNDSSALARASVYIVTVPTPVHADNTPDLRLLKLACETISSVLKTGDVVIFESTVYPGTTRELCIPILENRSGLRCFTDDNSSPPVDGFFHCGYSPERINPGDKHHNLKNTVKVVSGASKVALRIISELYSSIVQAGVYAAESLEVAEAAKIIENTQRDLNIALMNELSKICSLMGIDTHSVLRAAETKWNFLPFQPGLVGGHCIGVDPYYLTARAQELGYIPEVILAGRRINDSMGSYIAGKTLELLCKRHIVAWETPILVLGLTFKEDCPDIRNSKVYDIIEYFISRNLMVHVFDPYLNSDSHPDILPIGVKLLDSIPSTGHYNAVVVAVAHKEFKDLGVEGIRQLATKNAVIVDVKSVFEYGESDYRL